MKIAYRITMSLGGEGASPEVLVARLTPLAPEILGPWATDPEEIQPARFTQVTFEAVPALQEWQFLTATFQELVQFSAYDIWEALGDLAPLCSIEAHECRNAEGGACGPWVSAISQPGGSA